MKNQLNLLFVIAAIFGFAQQATASDTTDSGRVSAVVELSDGQLQSLLQTGTFKMSIPPRLKNKVNSLILKRPDRFKDDVAILFNDVDKRSNTIAIKIDDSTIDQIAYQPVELKIYESGYTNIMVRYTPGNRAEAKKPSKTDSVELNVRLNSGKSITGRLSYMTQIPLTSEIGKIKVKLEEVSQITFDDDGGLSVVMLNGDNLTGESNFSSVILKSRWGQERIKNKDIASISSTLSQTPAANPMMIPAPIASGFSGQTIYGNPSVSVMPPVTNAPVYNQAYPQQGFPIPAGRIDTVPRPLRNSQPYGMMQTQPMLQHNSYGNYSGYGTHQQHYYQQPSYQQHQHYYRQPIMPSQHGLIYRSIPQTAVPTNQIPVSTVEVIDSLIGQPLPMMTPHQANENWLFPRN
jgi:hypothetical protein